MILFMLPVVGRFSTISLRLKSSWAYSAAPKLLLTRTTGILSTRRIHTGVPAGVPVPWSTRIYQSFQIDHVIFSITRMLVLRGGHGGAQRR